MWIKICANTSLADAQRAVDLGADAVGFVFAPSARRVTVEEVGAITARLAGDAERVGVFPAMQFDGIRQAVGEAGLTGVQLHGGYVRDLLRRLRVEFGEAVTITQTLHWAGDATDADLEEQVREMEADGVVDRVLVDSKVGAALGGTGVPFDWNAAKGLFERRTRMVVAGGLMPENVKEAIKRLQPWGVDVASGVEQSPGKKDPVRLRLFLERARAAAVV